MTVITKELGINFNNYRLRNNIIVRVDEELKKYKYALCVTEEALLMQLLSQPMWEDAMSNRIAVQFIMAIKENKAVVEDKVIDTQVPSSWWDMFKETYFPNLLLKYFPVSYNDIHHKIHVVKTLRYLDNNSLKIIGKDMLNE